MAPKATYQCGFCNKELGTQTIYAWSSTEPQHVIPLPCDCPDARLERQIEVQRFQIERLQAQARELDEKLAALGKQWRVVETAHCCDRKRRWWR